MFANFRCLGVPRPVPGPGFGVGVCSQRSKSLKTLTLTRTPSRAVGCAILAVFNREWSFPAALVNGSRLLTWSTSEISKLSPWFPPERKKAGLVPFLPFFCFCPGGEEALQSQAQWTPGPLGSSQSRGDSGCTGNPPGDLDLTPWTTTTTSSSAFRQAATLRTARATTEDVHLRVPCSRSRRDS